MVTLSRPVPPTQADPIGANGQHSQPWAAYYEALSNWLAVAVPTNIGVGTTTNDNAASGMIGEYVIASGGPVGLSSGVGINIAHLDLTAGDWNVEGNIAFTPAGSTRPIAYQVGVSGTSGVLGSIISQIQFAVGFTSSGPANLGSGGSSRFSLAAPATAYLIARSTFTISTMSARGSIWGRRVR
jgi:hypothetical protein